MSAGAKSQRSGSQHPGEVKLTIGNVESESESESSHRRIDLVTREEKDVSAESGSKSADCRLAHPSIVALLTP